MSEYSVQLSNAMYGPDEPSGQRASFTFTLMINDIPQTNIDINVTGSSTETPIQLMQAGYAELKKALNGWASQLST